MTDNEIKLADVIDVDFGHPRETHELPIERRSTEQPECRHFGGFDYDETEHKVFCRKCGREVDAFVALVEISKGWNRYRGQLASYQDTIKRKQHEAKEAEKKRDRLMAQLRKLQKSTGEFETWKCSGEVHAAAPGAVRFACMIDKRGTKTNGRYAVTCPQCKHVVEVALALVTGAG